MEELKIVYRDKEYSYPEETTLLDISNDFKDNYEYKIIIGEMNWRLLELNSKITPNAHIEFYDYMSSYGNRVYENGLIFILSKVFMDELKSEIEVKYSIDKGVYIKTSKRITEEILKNISNEVKNLIKKDVPIQKSLVNRIDAINYYKSVGNMDKVNILKYSINTNVNLYRLENMYDYFFSPLPISTGCLKEFKLTYIDSHSLVLGYPNIYSKVKLPAYKHHENLFNEFKNYDNWCEKLGVQNISGLNERVSTGSIDDIVLLSENIQNNNLFTIAKNISSNKNIKLILIAGPSSSGKTTTSKKLELFLKGFGLNPKSLSVDDYFVDREKTPLLEDGSYDFESLDAIDTNLFNKDLKDLLEGKEVITPTYNFILGKREYINEGLKLEDNDILIIEGLHALNERMTRLIDRKKKFKIYLCPLTVLSLDNHNRVKTTDNRLLRRLVRDNRTRGYTAEDTLLTWQRVRVGEEKYVFPFQDEADVVFNTSLIYELGVLKTYAEPLLFSVPEDSPVYKDAVRLLNLFKNILPIANDNIPKDSIIREFIGDGYFHV